MQVTLTTTTTAARPMETGTSRASAGHAGVLSIAIAAVAGLAACGAGHGSGTASAFAWLRPQAPPADWTIVRIATGSELAYPPGWRALRGDRGTATAALIGSRGRFLGYLNLTPRQGDETLSNWASFRVEHNREEGDRSVSRLGASSGVRFLNGRGSCVKDSYETTTGAHFIEIACLVEGSRSQSVIVGAAPPDAWAQESGSIERAIDALRG